MEEKQLLLTADEIREIAGLPKGKEYDSQIHTGQLAARAQAEHLIEEVESHAVFIYPAPPYERHMCVKICEWESLRHEVIKRERP